MSSDQELIERFKDGDETAFEELLQRYDKKVLATAYKYVRSKDLAKDIYQETFIRVYKGLHRFEYRSQFNTWLYRIVVNTCLSFAKKEQRHEYAPLSGDDDDGFLNTLPDEASPDPSLSGIDKERKVAIHAAVKKLPDQQRMVFVLRHYQGYKMKEIAAMMNIKEGTIKRYLFHAVQKLRADLGYLQKEEL